MSGVVFLGTGSVACQGASFGWGFDIRVTIEK